MAGLSSSAKKNASVFGWDGRWLVVAAVVSYFALLSVIGTRTDFPRAWAGLGVSHLSPAFADLRVITAALDSSRDGHDPLTDNPRDPWKRPMNYPRVWLLLKSLGVTEKDTVPLGVCLVLTFYASFLILVGRITPAEGALYGVFLCSPALMLGVERANIDLLLFALLSLALVFLIRRSLRIWFFAVVILCSVLKLYPICGLALALRERTRSAIAILASGLGIFLFYVFTIRRDIKAIVASTPEAFFPAYGRRLLFRVLESYGFNVDPGFDSAVLAAALIAIAVLITLRTYPPQFSGGAAEKMVVGMAIYAGTFLMLNSFSYRLVFLLFAVPQLLYWCEEKGSYRPFAYTVLVAMGLTLWFSAPALPWQFFVKESANWFLFGVAAFLLLQISRPKPARE